jgi:non-ribosomal peptide synthetase component E (peptide arylation enzyme)
MYLTQNLRNSVQQTPDKVFTIFQGRRRTFAEVGERVARFAAGLHSLGLEASGTANTTIIETL